MNKINIKNKLISNMWWIQLLVLAFGVVFYALKGFDHDLLWHYKLGEEILSTHCISTQDTFSWQEGLTWNQHEWLFDVFIYLVIKYTDLAGFGLLMFINMFLLLFVGSKLSKPKYPTLYFVVCTFLLTNLPRNDFNRPAEFSLWLIIFFVWVYSKQFKFRRLLIAALCVFFANFHGGIVFTSIAIYTLMILVDYTTNTYFKYDKTYLKSKIADLIVMLISGLVSPSNIDLYLLSIRLPSFQSTNTIAEWGNLNLDYIMAIIVIFIVLALGYKLNKKDNLIETFRTVAIACALLVLSFSSLKATILFTVYVICFVYKYIEEFILDFIDITEKHIKDLRVIGIFITTLVMLVGTWEYLVFCRNDRITFQSLVEYMQPDKIIDYLKENMQDDETIMNGYNEGQYLIWNDIPCFLDSRQFPYTTEIGNGSLDDFNNSYNKYEPEEKLKYIHNFDFDYVWINDNYIYDRFIMDKLVDMQEYELVVTDKLNEDSDNLHYLYRKVNNNVREN